MLGTRSYQVTQFDNLQQRTKVCSIRDGDVVGEDGLPDVALDEPVDGARAYEPPPAQAAEPVHLLAQRELVPGSNALKVHKWVTLGQGGCQQQQQQQPLGIRCPF